jgi:hypothetical protein
MGVLKTAGVFGAIGGVGLIGYYLLNKYKPTIDKQQTFDIIGQGHVLTNDTPQNRKLWSIVAQYAYDNLGRSEEVLKLKKQLLTQNPLIIDDAQYRNLSTFYSDLHNKGIFEQVMGAEFAKLDNQKYWWEKRTKDIKDENWGYIPYDFKPFSGCYKAVAEVNNFSANINSGICFDNYWRYAPNEYMGYFWKLPDPSGKGISIPYTDCASLDYAIKRIQDRIVEQTKTKPNEKHRKVLEWYKQILEDYFELKGCRDKIEKQRLLDSAKSQTLFAIKAEDSVLGESQKNQNIYLGVGALVLVLSTGILLSGGSSSASNSPSKSSGILSNLVIVGGLAGMGYLIFKKPKVVLPNTQN